ncbi:MAG TPA: hypothetical protein VM867_12795 [Xanthobacteraceae bacterium]|nr:hypothetical protein [Xanthobacteraceae bacterium]
MRRTLVVLLLIASIVPAAAQLYNPNTPAGPVPIIPPVPPQAQPGMNPQPPLVTRDSRSNPLAPVPAIRQGSPAPETHQDKSIRCAQQGAQLGVPSGSMGKYIGECVTTR